MSGPMQFPMTAYILSVSADRGELLFQTATEHWEWPVSQPIPRIPGPNRKMPIVVFASFQEDNITHIADGALGRSAGTGLVQLKLHDLDELTRPFPFSDIESRVPARVRSHLLRYLRQGGVLPAKTRNAFIAFMAEADDTTADRISQLERDTSGVERLPPRSQENLALQKDTVGVALRIAGIEPQQLVGWHSGDHTARSFLDGLPEARVREDAMILTDFSTIPGFAEVRSATHYAAHTFQGRRDRSNRVTIIMANRLPLEQQTGADLIYFHEKYRSFVMVQYKAMEQEGGKDKFRWRAGDQFSSELNRMNALWENIKINNAMAGDAPETFRLSNNPFFLKFCSRVVFDPDSTEMFKGMYLPLDLWHILNRSRRLKGPRGGNVVTFANVERTINNTQFIGLLSKSWVGTSAAQSDYLESLIKGVIETGKTITLAVQHKDDAGDLPT